MIILGFDPGLTNTGYAVLKKELNQISLIESGLVKPKKGKALSARLFTIFSETSKLIEIFSPNLIVVENVFYGKNVQSAIKLGQAKASIMLSAEKYNIDLVDYSPREIKQSIVGNGSASKEQVAFMVKKIFKLKDEALKSTDVSDAIAVAWCGANRKIKWLTQLQVLSKEKNLQTSLLISICLKDYEELPDLNQEITILTYLNVREDLMELYGFLEFERRRLFTQLIGVSGIGPRTAINLLSNISVANFKENIIAEDVKSLSLIPGIGPKTAKRIILDIREKLTKDQSTTDGLDTSNINFTYDDIYTALSSLGYRKNQIDKAIKQLTNENSFDGNIEDVIKRILNIIRWAIP